jgi:hypothetical protein
MHRHKEKKLAPPKFISFVLMSTGNAPLCLSMSPQDLSAQSFLGLQLSHRIPMLGSDIPRGT